MTSIMRDVQDHLRGVTRSEAVTSLAETVSDEHTLAQALGWFSIGLGLSEVVAADHLADYFGLEGSERLLRLFGLREIASGVGILGSSNAAPWLWARVVGDALDLAAMGTGLKPSNPKWGRLAIATAAVAGVTALDVFCGWRLSGGKGARP